MLYPLLTDGPTHCRIWIYHPRDSVPGKSDILLSHSQKSSKGIIKEFWFYLTDAQYAWTSWHETRRRFRNPDWDIPSTRAIIMSIWSDMVRCVYQPNLRSMNITSLQARESKPIQLMDSLPIPAVPNPDDPSTSVSIISRYIQSRPDSYGRIVKPQYGHPYLPPSRK